MPYLKDLVALEMSISWCYYVTERLRILSVIEVSEVEVSRSAARIPPRTTTYSRPFERSDIAEGTASDL